VTLTGRDGRVSEKNEGTSGRNRMLLRG